MNMEEVERIFRLVMMTVTTISSIVVTYKTLVEVKGKKKEKEKEIEIEKEKEIEKKRKKRKSDAPSQRNVANDSKGEGVLPSSKNNYTMFTLFYENI